MTVSQGISQLGDIAVQSVAKEMQQMCEKGVWEGVSMNSLTDTQENKIISSSMFLKDKYHADGKFDKLKSRLLAVGDDPLSYTFLSCKCPPATNLDFNLSNLPSA